MKTMNMISRRSFLKAAMAASAVSALALTGCGGAASSTASTASGAAASSEAASSAVAGETFKVGIVNYVDHASLNQIVASVESRLDELGKEKGVTFDYADYYANAQADQSNLNQIGADLVQVALVGLRVGVVISVVKGDALFLAQLVQTALHGCHDLVEGSMIHIVDDAHLEGLTGHGAGSGLGGSGCTGCGAGGGRRCAAAAGQSQRGNGGSCHSGLQEAAAGDHVHGFHSG